MGPLASTGYWLKAGALAWQRELNTRLRPIGLTNAQFTVLAGAAWLGRQGGPPTQQEIADFAGTDRMMTSKLLQTLEAAQWVTRRPDPHDARTLRVELSVAGRAMIKPATAIARAVDQEFFGDDLRLREALRSVFHPARGPANAVGGATPRSESGPA